MATNTPGKKPNVRRISVPAASEAQFNFEGIVAVINFKVQAVTGVNMRLSFDPGGTFSTDNYWTVKSGTVYEERDINWTHGEQLYLRSEGADLIAEIVYWA